MTPQTMRAISLSGFGGSEVLKVAEAETPRPGERDILIRVAAAGVNRADLLQRQGNYPPPVGTSEILGLEVAARDPPAAPAATAAAHAAVHAHDASPLSMMPT